MGRCFEASFTCLFVCAVALHAGSRAYAEAPRGKPAAGQRAGRGNFDARTGLAEPALSALVAASIKNDRNDLVRIGERIGVARIGAVLAGGFSAADRATDRSQVLAALDAARVVEGGVRLLAACARLVLDGDSRVAEHAARTVGELLRADQLDKLAEWEVAPGDLGAACAVLSRTVSDGNAASPLRIAALEALSEAHVYCRGNLSLAGMANETAPEVRRAALLAPQLNATDAADTVGSLIEDPVPLVAGAAGTVWCRARYDSLRKGAVDGEVEKRRLFRMRMLVLADVAPAEDSAEMLPCLALSHDPEDQKAVEMARKRQNEKPISRW